MRIKIVSLVMWAVIFSPFVNADYTSQTAQQKMSGLGFLVGEWEGSGWIMNRERKKQYFNQTEVVEWRLDNTVMLIEGQGKDKNSGEITHHALAMISWQGDANKYRFVTALANSKEGLFEGYLNEKGQFVWLIKEDSGTRRFIIGLNDNGQWFEVGEYSGDGKKWYQFFEMTLNRVSGE